MGPIPIFVPSNAQHRLDQMTNFYAVSLGIAAAGRETLQTFSQ
jgi:hypothetical protein